MQGSGEGPLQREGTGVKARLPGMCSTLEEKEDGGDELLEERMGKGKKKPRVPLSVVRNSTFTLGEIERFRMVLKGFFFLASA